MLAVYTLRAEFDTPPGETTSQLFARLVAAAEAHVRSHRDPADDLTVTPPGERTVDGSHALFELAWAWAADESARRQAVGLTLARTPLGVQGQVTFREAAADGAGPADVYRPEVVDALLAVATARVNGEPLPVRPERLTRASVPGFVDDHLTATGRQLPIVVLTPLEGTGRPLVDPDRLMDELRGLARVVELADRDATFALTKCVTKTLSCFHGAVRLYWPGFGPTADPYRHPIFFPDSYPPGPDADDRLPRAILGPLAAAAHSRFADAPFARRVREVRELKGQAAVRARLEAAHADAEQGREWGRHLETAWDENRRLNAELDAARAGQARATEEVAYLQAQWATVGPTIAAARADADRARADADRYRERVLADIRRVEDAVSLARDEFADTLDFLKSAVDSAADSPFKDARRVFDLFGTLAAAMRAIRDTGSLGESLHDFMIQHRFEYKPHISQTAEGKYGDEYTFVYGGRKVLFENHVTLGKSYNPQECLSVHWLRDDARKVFVIGWCGKHRTNTRS